MPRERISFTELYDSSRQHWPESTEGVSLIAPAVYRLHEHLSTLAETVFKRHRLQSAEFETLCALRNSPDPHRITPTELYRKLLVSSGGMTKILARLEDKGLIDRPANPDDARSRLVELTNRGKALIEEVTEQLLQQEAALIEKAVDSSQLEKLLMTWLDNLERSAEDKPPAHPSYAEK
ncbi:MarR family transcriptional regulator [Marinobacterium sp. AK62]|uniref:MarR family transcriptional regulator n=1 Tax=Marinobacterium alkalitolerans TaxID=1542925 RepID=A0ABS3Z807_9GAMM|nr:MarR family transcriptional regulator [Marinobacterium alkalitolerans]MBP0047843.1 MarR family transcriptional regulator [Marinobacterium alkalitolerans]